MYTLYSMCITYYDILNRNYDRKNVCSLAAGVEKNGHRNKYHLYSYRVTILIEYTYSYSLHNYILVNIIYVVLHVYRVVIVDFRENHLPSAHLCINYVYCCNRVNLIRFYFFTDPFCVATRIIIVRTTNPNVYTHTQYTKIYTFLSMSAYVADD